MTQVWHQIIQQDLYVLSMAAQPVRVELRFGILTSGTQCVMTPGVLLMQMLHVGNLGTKRWQKLMRELILVKGLGKLYWIIWIAMEMRALYSSVDTMGCTTTTAGIVKMQV